MVTKRIPAKYCAITGEKIPKPYYRNAVSCTFNMEAPGIIRNPSKTVWISKEVAKKIFKWGKQND